MSGEASPAPAPGAAPLALYLHFPWCVRKCPYCDFNSHTLHGALPEAAYLEALLRDLSIQAPLAEGRAIHSVFLGGGTPSLFAPDSIAQLLVATGVHFGLAPGAEVTLEANPGAIERHRFADYRSAGVNRVSLGAQSFDAAQLTRLGRIHGPDDTRRAAEELHAAGLSNFNLDLMYGLPAQAAPAALADVEAALALRPAHLSHYQLTLESGTPFAANPPAQLPDDERTEAMLEGCQARLAAAGLRHYEVSAYALPGRHCAHNLNYWEFGDYLGVGAGAHGKLTRRADGTVWRTLREREPRRYLAHAHEPPARQAVSAAELPFEFMLNALRLLEGFRAEAFAARTGLPLALIAPTLQRLAGRGLLVEQGGRWRGSERGLRYLNDVLLEFLPERPEPTGGKIPAGIRA